MQNSNITLTILGDAKKLPNETNSHEFLSKIPPPLIEKPAIRIDLGINLDELDDHVGSIAAILSPKEFGYPNVPLEELKYDPIDLPPFALKRLRMQYLEVENVSPVLDFAHDDTSSQYVSLIYQVNDDLTMRELETFLTSVTNKLHTVIAVDLKKDLKKSIRRITVLGSRTRIVKEVLGIIDDIIDFSKKYPLDNPLPDMIEAYSEKYGWYKDYILTDELAVKLEHLIRRFRD
jgi:hypothetical protein